MMSVAIIAVLLIVTVGLLQFALSNGTAAERDNAEMLAFQTAESALHRGLSVLHNSDVIDPSAVPTTSFAENGGTGTYSASLSGLVWTITGTGIVANPASPGNSIRRTVSLQRQLFVETSPLWQANYANTPASCLTISNNADWNAPLYVNGDLCLDNNVKFSGSSLQVEGTLSLNNGASVGTSAAPIAVAKLKGGCLPGPHACSSADKVYASSLTTVTDALTKPPIDLPKWYARSKPGPLNPCTTGSFQFDDDGTMNGSRGTVTLDPNSSYTCRYDVGATTLGELSWNQPARRLTIAGTVFIDGNIFISGSVRYQGRGVLYAFGTVTVSNSARVCGVVGCDSTWDPGTNLLVLVAGAASGTGLSVDNNAVYQGAAYARSNYSLANNAANWGPTVANQFSIANNSGTYKAPGTLPPGAPGSDWALATVPGAWNG